ncbi:MAG: bifunctional riboflavin kinase/FAD synthetase [Bacteroidota bacterium]
MNVYRSIEKPLPVKNAVITIGTFDGVHKGHQSILKHIQEEALKIGGESVVITFHPHPRLLLRPDDKSLQLISTLDEKIALLQKYGVQNIVVVPFTREFSNLSAEAYISDFLVHKFHPKKIVIGYDHHFGNNRVGNIDYLQKFKSTYAYEVDEIPKQVVSEIDVSSTKIRKALNEGNVKEAAILLGHEYTLQGIIKKGKQLGRTIGFPTANINSPEESKLIPAFGVYAVKVQYKDLVYNGMMNIGKRPTVDGMNMTIEVNIFDFDKEIYGEELKIEFIDRIRDEVKFSDIEALKNQIILDKIQVLSILK